MENWVSINLPEGCPNICISFDRETAEKQVEKFGAKPLYGFEGKKETWLPTEIFVTYGGRLASDQKHPEVQTDGEKHGCTKNTGTILSAEVYRHFGLNLLEMKEKGLEHDWGICRKEEAKGCTGNMAGFGMEQSQQLIIDYDKEYDWVLVRRIKIENEEGKRLAKEIKRTLKTMPDIGITTNSPNDFFDLDFHFSYYLPETKGRIEEAVSELYVKLGKILDEDREAAKPTQEKPASDEPDFVWKPDIKCKGDAEDFGAMSQEKFEEMIQHYLKSHPRCKFAEGNGSSSIEKDSASGCEENQRHPHTILADLPTKIVPILVGTATDILEVSTQSEYIKFAAMLLNEAARYNNIFSHAKGYDESVSNAVKALQNREAKSSREAAV